MSLPRHHHAATTTSPSPSLSPYWFATVATSLEPSKGREGIHRQRKGRGLDHVPIEEGTEESAGALDPTQREEATGAPDLA